MQKYTLPDGQEVPMSVVYIAFLFPLFVMTVVTAFIIGPVLSLGLFAIMAITAGIVWLGSRNLFDSEPEDNDWFFDKFEQQ